MSKSPSGRKNEITIAEQQRRVERGIMVYLACFSFLLALAWVPYLVHWRLKIYLPFLARWPQLAYFPLGNIGERFGDLAHFASVHQRLTNHGLGDLDHLAGTMFPKNYGPLAVLLYLFLLGVCSPFGIVVFLAIVIGALTFGAFLLWCSARRSPGYRPFMIAAIFGTALFAYPSAETELRANIEGLLWIGYALGIALMFSRRWSQSASVLAIAACIKPYPIFFFVILFWRRKYKEIVVGCAVLAMATTAFLALLGHGSPARGARHISGSSDYFFANYIAGFRDVQEIVADHSLFQTSKSIARVVKARSFHLPQRDYEYQPSLRIGYILFKIYLPLAAICTIWVVYRIRNMPFLNQVFSLSITLTLFPLLAGDYTLTILYLPMGLFLLFLLREVATGRAPLSQARMLSILVPCAWLMAPQPLLGIWGGDVRSVVLLGLLLIVMDIPMPMSIDSDQASPIRGEKLNVRLETS